jgi:hypothetical protein
MAISLDATASSTSQTSSPITWNHTCTGSNVLLIVSVHLTNAGLTPPTADSVTYNGVSMNKVRSDANSTGSHVSETSIWFLHAPATGTNQVSVNCTFNGISPTACGNSVSYTGAQQSDTADAVTGGTGSGNADQTLSLNTVSDNCWVVSAATLSGAGSMAADETQRGLVTLSITGIGGLEDTNAAVSPAGNQTMGWTTSGSVNNQISQSVASFAPASIAAPITGFGIMNPGKTWIRRFAKAEHHPYTPATPIVPTSTAPGRYFVGAGSSNWSSTSSWATTSGGTPGASVPVSTDDVFLDWNSYGNLTIDTNTPCNSLNCFGFRNTLTLPSSITLSIGSSTAGNNNVAFQGDNTHGMVFSIGSTTTSIFNFVSTSATQQTVTSGSLVMPTLTFNGVGGSWIFGDNISMVSSKLTLTAGSLSTGNFNLIAVGIFSSGSAVCNLSLGSSTLTFNFNGNSGVQFSNTANFTLNAGTSNININNGNSGLAFGNNNTYYNVNVIYSNGSSTISGTGSSFNNLTLSGGNQARLMMGDSFIVTGLLTIGSSSVATPSINVPICASITSGTQRTLTVSNTPTIGNVILKDIAISGSGTPYATTFTGDGGNNSGMTLSSPRTLYWVNNSTTYASTSTWSLISSSGATGNNPPMPQDTIIIDSGSITSSSKTMTIGWQGVPTLDFSNVLNNPTVAFTNTNGFNVFFGDLILKSGMTASGTTSLAFLNDSVDQSINTNGVSITSAVGLIDKSSSSLKLASNLTTTAACNFSTLMGSTSNTNNIGTFDANGFNFTASTFTSNSSLTRTINMGAGTWTLTGTGVVWSTTTGTNLTLNVGTSILAITDTSSSAKSIGRATNQPLYDVTVSGGTGIVSFTTASTSTIHTLNATAAAFIRFNAPATYIFTGNFPSGTSGYTVTIDSNTPGTGATLSFTGTGLINCDYLSLKDSLPNATKTWFAGHNSTLVSNTGNWILGTGFTGSNAGALSFAGANAKADRKLLSGVLSFVGSIISRAIVHILAAILSFVGLNVRTLTKGLAAATLSFTSTFIKSLAKKLASATLSFVGNLASIYRRLKSLTGILNLSVSTGTPSPTLLQTASGNNGAGSSSVSATFASNTTSGSLYVIVVYYLQSSAAVSSASDTEGGNTYSFIYKDHKHATSNIVVDFAYAPNVTGGTTNTITVSFSFGVVAAIIVREYAGLSSAPLDVKQINDNGTTTSPTSNATATTSQASELVVGMIGFATATSSVTVSAGAGYGNIVTKRDSETGSQQVAMEDNIVSSIGAQTATFGISSLTGTSVVAVATFTTPASGANGFIKQTSHNITGTLAFVGSLVKRLVKGLVAASLSFAGAISTGRAYLKALVGILSFIVDKTASISRITGQDASNGASASSTSVSYPGATTTNNLLIAAVSSLGNTGQVPTVTTAGWNLAIAGGASIGANNQVALYYKIADGTETTVNASVGGAVNAIGISIFEYTGNVTTSITDGTAAVNTSNGSLVTTKITPNITTTNANDLIFYFIGKGTASPGVITWSSGATVFGYTGTSFMETICGQLIASTTQTNYNDTASWTGGGQTVSSAIVAFKAGAGTTGFIKATNHKIVAILSFVGSNIRALTHALAATLSFVGSTFKKFIHSFSGVLNVTATTHPGSISRITSQDATGNAGSTSVTVAYPGATTPGNLLIAAFLTNSNVLNNSITGWTKLIEGTATGVNGDISIHYKIATGSETNITGTNTNGGISVLDIFEYTGNGNPILLDGTAAAQNTASSVTIYTTPLITTSYTNDLVFSLMSAGGLSAPSWATNTLIGTNINGFNRNFFCGEYLSTTTLTNFTDTANWTGSNSAGSLVAAFQAAPSAVSFKKSTNHRITAAVSFVGALISRINQKFFTAALSFSGAITRNITRAFTGAVSFAGSLPKKWIHGMLSSLSFSGLATHPGTSFSNLTAALSFHGVFGRNFSRAFTAVLNFTIIFIRPITTALTATLNFINYTFGSGMFGSGGNQFGVGTIDDLLKQTNRKFTATVNMSGSLIKIITHKFIATLSFVGALLSRNIARALTGALSFVGAIIISVPTTHILTGTLSFSGSFTKRARPFLTATLSFSGSITRFLVRGLLSMLSFSGSFVRNLTHHFTATLSFVGILLKTTIRAIFAATLSFTGVFVKSSIKIFAATLNFTTASLRSMVHGFTAALNFVGIFIKTAMPKALTATLSFTGVFLGGGQLLQTLTGTLSFTGKQVRAIVHRFTAALSPVGTLVISSFHSMFVSLTGSLTFAGTTAKKTVRALPVAVLSFAGMFTKTAKKTFAATLNLTIASFVHQIGKPLAAVLSFTGTFVKSIQYPLSAALTFAGSFLRAIRKSAMTAALSFAGTFIGGGQLLASLTSTLSFTGVFRKSAIRLFAATLSFTTSLIRRLTNAFQAGLSFSGRTTRAITHRLVSAVLSFAGAVAGGHPKFGNFGAQLTFSTNFFKSLIRFRFPPRHINISMIRASIDNIVIFIKRRPK